MHLSHEQYANIGRLFPEVVLCVFGLLIMVVDPFVSAARQRILGWLGFVGALAASPPSGSRRITRAWPIAS